MPAGVIRVAPPEENPWIPYYGYGAGVVRLSLRDNSELGGEVRGDLRPLELLSRCQRRAGRQGSLGPGRPTRPPGDRRRYVPARVSCHPDGRFPRLVASLTLFWHREVSWSDTASSAPGRESQSGAPTPEPEASMGPRGRDRQPVPGAGQPEPTASSGPQRAVRQDRADRRLSKRSYASYMGSWDEPRWEDVWVLEATASRDGKHAKGSPPGHPGNRHEPGRMRISAPSLLVLGVLGLAVVGLTPAISRFWKAIPFT